MTSHDLTSVRGIGPAAAAKLVEHGITSVAALAALDVDSIAAVPTFGDARAAAIHAAACELVSGASAPADAATAKAAPAGKPSRKKDRKKAKAKKKDKGKGRGKAKDKRKGKRKGKSGKKGKKARKGRKKAK